MTALEALLRLSIVQLELYEVAAQVGAPRIARVARYAANVLMLVKGVLEGGSDEIE
jgi:hypothetical protein